MGLCFYRDEVVQVVLQRVSLGDTLQEIDHAEPSAEERKLLPASIARLPSLETINKWRRDKPEFQSAFAQALEFKADILADEALREARGLYQEVKKCPKCLGTGRSKVKKKKNSKREGNSETWTSNSEERLVKGKAGPCGGCMGTGRNSDQKSVVACLDKLLQSLRWSAARLNPQQYGDHLQVPAESMGGAHVVLSLNFGRGERKIINAAAKEIPENTED